jgi:hypothetical protein
MTTRTKWLIAITPAVITALGAITSAEINSQAQIRAKRIEVLQKAQEKDPKYCEKHLFDTDADVKLVCDKTSPPPDLATELPGTWLDGNRDRFKLWNKDDSLNWLGRGSGGKLELPPTNRLPKGKLLFDFHSKNPDG